MADTAVAEGAGEAGRGGPQQAAVPAVQPPRLATAALPALPQAIDAALGQPIEDLPPIVEPLEFVEVPVEPRRPSGAQRPVRRQFLAPVGDAPSQAPERSPIGSDVRRRTRAPLALVPAAPDASKTTAAEPPGSAPPTPRRWRGRIAAGLGISAALAVAVAAELGVNLDRLHAWQGLVMAKLAGPPPPVPTEPAERLAYYRQRAEAGDAEAQLALAILYAKGDGVTQDYTAAARWFGAAAEKGLVRAQYDLGVLYERGRGVPLDPARSALWYRKAAEQNHPLAQYNLAVAYMKGQGVRRDFAEAANWYRRAAGEGVVAAMVNLAILYERGEGVGASTADAYAWYRAAGRRGSQAAGRRADELLQAFSTTEQTRAEARMADVAASIHDSLGERSRLVAGNAPASPAANKSNAVLRSGIESRWSPPQNENAAENP